MAAGDAEASWWKASGQVVAIISREPMTGEEHRTVDQRKSCLMVSGGAEGVNVEDQGASLKAVVVV